MGKLSGNDISPFVLTCAAYEKETCGRDCSNKKTKELREKLNQMALPTVPRAREMAPLTPFASLILPMFDFLRYIGWSHFKLEFDPDTQTFQYISGSIFRKALCCTVYVLSTLCNYGDCEVTIYKEGRSNFTALLKMTQFCYVVMDTGFFYVLFKRGPNFAHILDFAQRLGVVLEQNGCSFPKQTTYSKAAVGLIGFCVLHAVLYILEPFMAARQSNGEGDLIGFWEFYSEGLVTSIVVTFGLVDDQEMLHLHYKISDNYPYSFVIASAILKFFSVFAAALVWITAVMLLVFWGILFSEIFKSFVDLTRKGSSENNMQDIRKFNLIVEMLDKFNDAMGPLTLVICLACIAHFSVNGLILVDSKMWWLSKLVVGFGLLYCSTTFFVASNVNSQATKFVGVMKSRFQDYYTWSKEDGARSQGTMLGMMFLLNDIQTNNIGFKGCGYFTITYSFIGTVLSVIFTYAIVVLQFKKEK